MAKEYVPIIGKDVIESLTVAMYEDARFIYREYIQNSADQIDKAIKDGLVTQEEAEIYIDIDADQRTVLIEDNATGIAKDLVSEILQNVAQSTKQRGVDKGFRGIGRLGGLAYCEKLIFETSFKGEDVKSILTWDASSLRQILNNRQSKEDAVTVIQSVTTLTIEKEDVNSHYFKVILQGVNTPDLLDKDGVQEYLSMVAPLPYPNKFIFRSKIYEKNEKEDLAIDEYKILLNGEQLFKGYSTHIKKDESHAPYDVVIDLIFFEAVASDGRLLYWGWHSLSEKNQSMNEVNYCRGFRLRKSNIQIGDEFSLLKLQRDKRFNFYFFGEVHGVHPDLIPNARRDNFVENDIQKQFEERLQNYFHTEVYRLCHSAADINSFVRKTEETVDLQAKLENKRQGGFTDKKEVQEMVENLERKKEEALKAKKKIEKIESDIGQNADAPLYKILKRVVPTEVKTRLDSIEIVEDEKVKYRTDNLTSLNKEQRKFLGRVFSIIRDSLDSGTAESLIQKIEEELK
jgi:hypothetical protein